jgi:hypothetical protein
VREEKLPENLRLVYLASGSKLKDLLQLLTAMLSFLGQKVRHSFQNNSQLSNGLHALYVLKNKQ